mmetsp:Transcript_21440/g.87550  ORF Transcript_21440/g.87550 Transcript_21440/m.87550 type:complete len:394 (+) Transcript_21440:349-1530(+)|eukprot:CAMPEP_0113964156 /NCGR_PEP_ID=MMETSP0011_2-20120614/6955_1 /TAXON_ID=101924 /ORGANISM="Rhodosorus marinus" /LENGTH=393 /DNA_ID=CAMNT_0000976371 /DNA_START=292 /DNA_END=1473 /DNA_ORIENTATION=- /assembly_acc=CAM_ASM_000156
MAFVAPGGVVRRRDLVSCNGWLDKVSQWIGEDRYEDVGVDVPGLEVVDLKKSFVRREKGKKGKRRRKEIVHALNGLSFVAERGQIYGLLGPNACGKSTTMKCIGSINAVDSGTIRVFGVDVSKQPYKARQMFGYVHQDAGVDKILTGREHLELFADLAHVDTARKEQNIEDLITALRMENFVDLETGVYSGGIKRRLDIALAMVHQPGLLLLDEPTTGLDVESRAIIWDLLREFRENGGCVLLTSHYLEEVDTLADVVGIMDKGSLIASGTTAELKESLGGTRVQIRIEEFTSQTEAERALEHLKSKGAIRQGLINPGMGNALELVVPANRDTSDTVEILLRDAGFDSMFSVSKSRMSLGDVYLTATGRSLQDADLIAQAARDPKQTKKEQIL